MPKQPSKAKPNKKARQSQPQRQLVSKLPDELGNNPRFQAMLDDARKVAKLPKPEPIPQRETEPEIIMEWRRRFDRGEFDGGDRRVSKRKGQRKTRSDKGQLQLLSTSEIKRARSYYKKLLGDDLQKWRRPQTAAKYITEHFLERPEASWQTIRDHVVIPVLVQRNLIEPKKQ